MTREIKFRIRDTQAKILYHSKNSKTPKTRLRQLHLYFIDSLMGLDDYCDKFLKIMQYTGLKDSTGKDIYEGDIVSIFHKDNENLNTRGVVEWHKDKCCFRVNTGGPWNPSLHDFLLTYEIIGNIFENPELMSSEVE